MKFSLTRITPILYLYTIQAGHTAEQLIVNNKLDVMKTQTETKTTYHMFAVQNECCSSYRRSTNGIHYMGTTEATTEREAVIDSALYGDENNTFIQDDGSVTDQNGNTIYEADETGGMCHGDWTYYVVEDGSDNIDDYEHKAAYRDRRSLLSDDSKAILIEMGVIEPDTTDDNE